MTCETIDIIWHYLILFTLVLELVILNLNVKKGHMEFWANHQCCTALYMYYTIHKMKSYKYIQIIQIQHKQSLYVVVCLPPCHILQTTAFMTSNFVDICAYVTQVYTSVYTHQYILCIPHLLAIFVLFLYYFCQ